MRLIMKCTAALAFIFTFSSAQAAETTKIRLGWQVPWAVQGQIVQVLKHTDIAAKNGLEIEFVGRTFGPELNELALNKHVDMLLTADQPAATLFAKDAGWLGIGRLMYNRTATYVPAASPIKNIRGLKGKTVAVPAGAAAERVTLAALKKAGLNPEKDLKIINLDIKEQAPLVTKDKNATSWGNIDAMSGFDPTPAIFEDAGFVRVLDTGKVVSMVLASNEFMKANPGTAERFLTALIDAYDYYRQNRAEADGWFQAEAKMQASPKVFTLAASLEPNLKVKRRKEIRVRFTKADFDALQTAADFISPKIKKNVDMRKYVVNDFAARVK